jgi:hypothetical protein
MTDETTFAHWSPRLQNIRQFLDRVITNNPLTEKFPALHADDYDFYLQSVIKINPFHNGNIMYMGREIKRSGRNKNAM